MRLRALLTVLALLLGVSVEAQRRLNIIAFTVTPPVPSGQFASTNLHYDGAFRISNAQAGGCVPGTKSAICQWAYNAGNQSGIGGAGVMAYWPQHNTLLIANANRQVAEIEIPTAVNGAIGSLPFALALHSGDITGGKMLNIDGNLGGNGAVVGGLLPLSSTRVVTSIYAYYEAGVTPGCGVPPAQPCKQTTSHFVTDFTTHTLDTIAAGDVTGPWQVGTGFQSLVPSDTYHIAGFVSGYMTEIPTAWKALLGGTHFTGNGGGVSIVNRTSNGPAISTFNPSDLGVTNPAPVGCTTPCLGYPQDDNVPALNHTDIGFWSQTTWPLLGPTYYYNGNMVLRGVFSPTGYDSLVFVGWQGSAYLPVANNTGFCYGPATVNPSLHQTLSPVGGHPWCFDPVQTEGASLGVRQYPEVEWMVVYDLNDLLTVKSGAADPWDLKPVVVFQIPDVPAALNTFVTPTGIPCWDNTEAGAVPSGFDVGRKRITGLAHDPTNKRIWLALGMAEQAYDCSNGKPIILQYHYD